VTHARVRPLKSWWEAATTVGRFAILRDVVEHYNSFMKPGLSERELSEQEKSDPTEYLKSL
jgi:hypothetical protein